MVGGREAGLIFFQICMSHWKSTTGMCHVLQRMPLVFQLQWEKNHLKFDWNCSPYRRFSLRRPFSLVLRHFDFTVWFVCLANELETRFMGGILHLKRFFFLLVSLLNLLKFRTQRPLGADQPTPQMARGSETVSTLKRAKSRGSSPAGRTEHEWGISTNFYSPPLGICKMICGKFV